MVAHMTITVSAPLPPTVPPQAVLEALHESYEPLIRPHPYLRRFKRRRLEVSEVVDDPFFRTDGRKLEAYEVVERVPLLPVPGFHKDITVPAVFQSFDDGVRCRADASAGVRIWSVYEVRPAPRDAASSSSSSASSSGDQAASPPSPPPGQHGVGAWELFETAKVECSALVKPFVARSFQNAHREILKGTIAEIARSKGLPLGPGPGEPQ